jgi:hypothetical protein
MAGQNTNVPRDHLKSHIKEGMKMYITYDISARMEYVYEAPTDAVDGAPCLVTQYAYVGATTRVEKMKESQGTWVSATMDI